MLFISLCRIFLHFFFIELKRLSHPAIEIGAVMCSNYNVIRNGCTISLNELWLIFGVFLGQFLFDFHSSINSSLGYNWQNPIVTCTHTSPLSLFLLPFFLSFLSIRRTHHGYIYLRTSCSVLVVLRTAHRCCKICETEYYIIQCRQFWAVQRQR